MKSPQLNWRIGAVAGVAAVIAAGVAISRWISRPPDPDETERSRRSYVNQIGRIVEGHIIELLEVKPQTDDAETRSASLFRRKPVKTDDNNRRQMVCYSYSISGVSYETAQDLTGLEARVPFDRLAAGQPASVKYDPSNPMNSILLADDWSGLH